MICNKFKLNGVNIILVILVCLGVYIFHSVEHRKYKYQQDKEKYFLQLQEKCFIQDDNTACKELNGIVERNSKLN